MANRTVKSKQPSKSSSHSREVSTAPAPIGSNMNFATSEAFKLLRTNLMFSFSGKEGCSVIGTTSTFRGEGKSTVTVNLAYTLAQTRSKVLLIDGDMRLPTMADKLGLKPSPGLSNLLAGMNSASEAIQEYKVQVLDGKDVTLDVFTAGDIPPNPSELLGSKRMEELVGYLKAHYDYIFLDLPPVTAVTDPLVASKLVDGMIVVVRNNHVVRSALADTIRQLDLVEARILGFVFNGAGDSSSGYYRKKTYYKNKYYYKKQS